MDVKDLENFNQAVALAKAGEKASAYAKLRLLAEAYPQDVNCFLWLAFTAPSIPEAERALEIAEILDPHNPSLTQAKDWLDQEKAKANMSSTAAYTMPPNFNYAQSFTEYPNPGMPPQYQQLFGTGAYQQPQMGYYQQPPMNYYGQPPMPFYGQPMRIPGVKMSALALIGYFIIYFIACVAAIYGVSFILSLIGPMSYNSYYRGYSRSPIYAVLAVLLIVLGTAIWATADSAKRRTKFGPNSASHPVVVFICCIFFWTIAFPLFLTGRRRSVAFYGV